MHMYRTMGAAVVCLVAVAGCIDTAVSHDSERSTLVGQVVDWDGTVVSDAEVVLAIGDVEISERVRTDADGRYAVTVPVEPVLDGFAHGAEINLLIYSPTDDLPPLGSAEGDRVRLTPLTLAEFVADMGLLAVSDRVAVRTAHVPLQAKAYPITAELMTDGGELTWSFDSSPIGGPLEVTLVVAPGSIHLVGEEAQRQITLTPIPREKAPMQIPAGGTGVIWTIQPRDVVFDPPARVRITGDRLGLLGLTNTAAGTRFDVFGASLEQGWQRFGEVEVLGVDNNRVTLESTAGIISRGAWGHVFSGTNTDAGCLVSCYDEDSGTPIPCAIIDDNWGFDGSNDRQVGWVSLFQWDYNNLHRVFYYTDIEPVCAGCSNNGHPKAQLAFGLNLCAMDPNCDPAAPAPTLPPQDISLLAVRLDCLGLTDIADADARDAVLMSGESGDVPPSLRWGYLEQYTSTKSVSFGVAHRNFSYQANFYLPGCPASN